MIHPLPLSKKTLLSDDDPSPCGLHNPVEDAPWLFLCEHAGKRIPNSLKMLGLPQKEINRHIGWDIGIFDLAKKISNNLNAPLFFQRYSRLVIDCNRPLTSDGLIPEISDNTIIPGNIDLSSEEREKRITEIWKPYQNSIHKYLKSKSLPGPVIISLHSFTPIFNGKKRPWHIGLLYNRFPETALFLKERIKNHNSSLNIGFNQPYEVSDEDDYTIPVFGERMGFAHVLMEIRQDLIEKKTTRKKWEDLLTNVFQELNTDFRYL
jgi:predicted N-formylglutamate amidohydrolase